VRVLTCRDVQAKKAVVNLSANVLAIATMQITKVEAKYTIVRIDGFAQFGIKQTVAIADQRNATFKVNRALVAFIDDMAY